MGDLLSEAGRDVTEGEVGGEYGDEGEEWKSENGEETPKFQAGDLRTLIVSDRAILVSLLVLDSSSCSSLLILRSRTLSVSLWQTVS